MKKLLIATRADNSIKEITDVTHPIIRSYAHRCKADFLILSDPSPTPVNEAYRIMITKTLLEEYGRVLHIDSDVIINKDCPNLFGIVPEDYIGTVLEDVGSRQAMRKDLIRQAQRRWGYIGWQSGYINTGVIVVSREHSSIFETVDNEYWGGFGYDDVHLGYQIRKKGFKILSLPFQWNHMSMFSEPWNGSADRFKSYMIHYAGHASFPDRGNRSRVQLIKDDAARIYG